MADGDKKEMNQKLAVEQPGAVRGAQTWLMPVLAGLFWLSGTSALIYQVLWLRQLSLVFGVTTYAASTVLASFMAGLAFGSYVAGRAVDRARNPLLLYGAAEVLIGLSALATPLAFSAIEQVYVSLYPATSGSLTLLTPIRFLFSFAVLIVPTTLMGMTLPIIVKSSLLNYSRAGQRISLLYAANTTGAIIGTLLAGYYLIGGVGIRNSLLLAAAINIAAGLAAIALSLVLRPATVAHESNFQKDVFIDDSLDRHRPEISERARKIVLIVFALSGLVSLALELIWFRILTLLLEVTSYAFTTMLAAVLAGIAAGSYLVAPFIERRWNWLKILALLEIAIAIIAVASLAALAYAFNLFQWDMTPVRRGFGDRIPTMVGISLVAVFPISLLMGVAFPIGLRLWAGGDDEAKSDIGKRVGIFYSLNVGGAILGSLLAGFFLLPWLGSKSSLILIAVISLVSGLLLLGVIPRQSRFKIASAAVGVVLFIAAALTIPNPFTVALAHRYPGEKLLWHEEGVQTTVSIHESDGVKRLYLDGVSQMYDTQPQRAFHTALALYPLLIHEDPKDALVVGLGGGVTTAMLSRYPGLNVEVVELSESVVRAAHLLKDANYDVMGQPNIRMRIDDGRNFMMLSDKKYDIITADVIRPFHAGAGNVYSREYFELVRNALKDDGVVFQYLGRQAETHYKIIMRTFLSVFPDATLWSRGRFLVGGKKPLQIDRAVFERKMQMASLREAFEMSGIDSFESFLAAYTAGPQEMLNFVGEGPVLTDDRPMVEYFLSLPAGRRRFDNELLQGDVMRHVKP